MTVYLRGNLVGIFSETKKMEECLGNIQKQPIGEFLEDALKKLVDESLDKFLDRVSEVFLELFFCGRSC